MQHSKILNKLRQNPQDWRIEELETLAKQLKIGIRKTGGSHVVFHHPKWVEMLCVPARRPIKAIYIKKLISLIALLEVPDEKK